MWMGRSVAGNETVAVTWTSVAQKVLSVAEGMKY